MKRSVLDKKLRQKLAAKGVTLDPGGDAERGVAFIADLGARVATEGERAVQDTRAAFVTLAERAREMIHEVTKPPSRRKKK